MHKQNSKVFPFPGKNHSGAVHPEGPRLSCRFWWHNYTPWEITARRDGLYTAVLQERTCKHCGIIKSRVQKVRLA